MALLDRERHMHEGILDGLRARHRAGQLDHHRREVDVEIIHRLA